MGKVMEKAGLMRAEPVYFFGNCAVALEYVSSMDLSSVQNKWKQIGKIFGFELPKQPGYRRFGKYKVKETFAGEESLTSLLTQYVERTVAIRY